MLIAVFATTFMVAVLPAHADAIPDMGKDMAKSQMDSPGAQNDVLKQKHRYKTMKMKKDEMAKKMALSTPGGKPAKTATQSPKSRVP